jgi:hypothetical protein
MNSDTLVLAILLCAIFKRTVAYVHTGCVAHLASYSKGTEGCFPVVKVNLIASLLQCQVKNESYYTSTLLHAFLTLA